jgi:hypothetical protein
MMPERIADRARSLCVAASRETRRWAVTGQALQRAGGRETAQARAES